MEFCGFCGNARFEQLFGFRCYAEGLVEPHRSLSFAQQASTCGLVEIHIEEYSPPYHWHFSVFAMHRCSVCIHHLSVLQYLDFLKKPHSFRTYLTITMLKRYVCRVAVGSWCHLRPSRPTTVNRTFSEFYDPYPQTARQDNGQYLIQAVYDGDARTVGDALDSGIDPNYRWKEVSLFKHAFRGTIMITN